jgi:lipopolysaccharide biosynthesis regulator YciM
MRFLRSFVLAMATVVLSQAFVFGQAGDEAKKIYSSSQDSVFLVYLNDSSGTPSALGSAFLVAPRLLVTNAHVADAGSPVLAVGPVRIPLKILRTDEKNDLALLSVDVDLTSRPLPLASEAVSPGEQVFAIGNPEGLEKTISQGIISGLRKRGDRDLLQVTSPISHGSSGGPILNAKGEVVGVAVEMLEDGQNLNFAVPVTYVRAILEQKTDAATASNVDGSLSDLKDITSKRAQAEYSDDFSSEYQQQTRRLHGLMETIVASTSREDALTEVACLGTDATDLSDTGIKAARKLLSERPTSEHRALLSYVLYDRASDESIKSQFAQKDSDIQLQANTAHDKYLSEASREATESSRTAKGQGLLIANFVLGNTMRDHKEYSDAISLHSLVAGGSARLCGNDLAKLAIINLIYESNNAKRSDDAEKWFRRYASLYKPEAYEWDAEGDRRDTAKDYINSAKAYERAAEENNYYGYDYCFASRANYLLPVTNSDGVLADGRKCVAASVQSKKENEHYFKSTLPLIYRVMAGILDDRGVYQPALEYVKEAVDSEPENPFALITEAKIFEDLQRYSECISASQAAIRASDAKYPFMQFRLGQCYFDMEDWSKAAASYRLAVDADRSDLASAFNLALSLARQGYTSDANQWLREALNRKPDDEQRAKILSLLK